MAEWGRDHIAIAEWTDEQFNTLYCRWVDRKLAERAAIETARAAASMGGKSNEEIPEVSEAAMQQQLGLPPGPAPPYPHLRSDRLRREGYSEEQIAAMRTSDGASQRVSKGASQRVSKGGSLRTGKGVPHAG